MEQLRSSTSPSVLETKPLFPCASPSAEKATSVIFWLIKFTFTFVYMTVYLSFIFNGRCSLGHCCNSLSLNWTTHLFVKITCVCFRLQYCFVIRLLEQIFIKMAVGCFLNASYFSLLDMLFCFKDWTFRVLSHSNVQIRDWYKKSLFYLD